jgi:hypothetical protein
MILRTTFHSEFSMGMPLSYPFSNIHQRSIWELMIVGHWVNFSWLFDGLKFQSVSDKHDPWNVKNDSSFPGPVRGFPVRTLLEAFPWVSRVQTSRTIYAVALSAFPHIPSSVTASLKPLRIVSIPIPCLRPNLRLPINAHGSFSYVLKITRKRYSKSQ